MRAIGPMGVVAITTLAVFEGGMHVTAFHAEFIFLVALVTKSLTRLNQHHLRNAAMAQMAFFALSFLDH